MLPDFLVPETTTSGNASGPVLSLEDTEARRILITLGITEIVEQESLELSIWDSPDGREWGKDPIAAFPQKFYKGNWAMVIDLARHPETRFLQARWIAQRWGRGDHKPHFTFFVFAQRYS